ncbi:MAG TPA: lamin tail domain-containing protein [Bacteroidales bacterium]|nr:lamin tail domain-containing protein [Bacteroidales bacterium]
MKKVILLLCFIPFTLSGQVSYDFETGNSSGWIQSTAGHWATDTTLAVAGQYSFHHVFDSNIAGTDQAGTRLRGLNPSESETFWSFMIRHGTDPSASNSWAYFLMSDADPSNMLPGGTVNGFAVGVNITGYDDTLRLWKVRNGSFQAIGNFGLNWQNDIGTAQAAVIGVKRTMQGLWQFSVADQKGTVSSTGYCNDPELFGIHWLGVFYRYTSTRDRLLWLDDISVSGTFGSLSPPVISGLSVENENCLKIHFSNDISPLSAIPSGISYDPGNSFATSVEIMDARTFLVCFALPFPDRTGCRLAAMNICDEDSLCTAGTGWSFTPARAAPGDVAFSEIMADPSPRVYLPEREYIELVNTSGFIFNLEGWKLISGNDEFRLPEISILPGQFLILCNQADTGLFSVYGRYAGMKQFPVLNNAGKLLLLVDEKGRMIHGICYNEDWYGDVLKSGGGWSLEMIDNHYPFYSEGNWRASIAWEGGTPGKKNSVEASNPDPGFAGIVNAFPADSETIILTFSEPVREPSEISALTRIDGTGIKSISPSGLMGNEFIIRTSQPLDTGKTYRLGITGSLTDYAGNEPERKFYMLGLTGRSSPGDVVFNELLFNPLPGDADYIELFNRSGKNLNAADFLIASVNDETADTTAAVSLCDTNRCFLPGRYYAISTDRQGVLKRYPYSSDSSVFNVDHMPSMPDDGGHLVLFDKSHNKTDEVRYNERMHSPLLSGKEGVSLEKVRPSLNSLDFKSWTSASGTSGWGTPGLKNSVFSDGSAAGKEVAFSSTRITPDNDGYEDVLVMDFKMEGSANVISIRIFDETGDLVRNLAMNIYSGQSFSEVWDGTDDDGSIVANGIYIILITGYDDTGKTFRIKKACAVFR